MNDTTKSKTSEERFEEFRDAIIDAEHCVSPEVKMGWHEQDDYYLPIIQNLEEENKKLKEGSYGTTNPDTITINLKHYNDLQSQLDAANKRLAIIEKILWPIRNKNKDFNEAYRQSKAQDKGGNV